MGHTLRGSGGSRLRHRESGTRETHEDGPRTLAGPVEQGRCGPVPIDALVAVWVALVTRE